MNNKVNYNKFCVKSLIMLTINEKLIIYRTYLNSNLSVIQTFRALRGILNPVPSVNSIRQVVVHLFQTGNMNHQVLQNRNRPVTRNANLVNRINVLITRNPRKSVRKLAAECNTSISSVHRVLRNNLHLKPFKIQNVQQLLPQDMRSRLTFCNWSINQINNGRDFLNNLMITDEAHFNLKGKTDLNVIKPCTNFRKHNF